jgi:four helix bundle protein
MGDAAKIRDYKDLIVWQKSRELVKLVYALAATWPAAEKFGLMTQTQRAAISVPANIAEGHLRSSRKEFLQFLSIAAGSVAELETLLLLSVDVNYTQEKDCQKIFQLILEIRRMLFVLRKKLKVD